jgi:hypothetical protein
MASVMVLLFRGRVATYRMTTTRRAAGDVLVQILRFFAAPFATTSFPPQVALGDELRDEKLHFDHVVFVVRRIVEGDGVDADRVNK